MPEPTSRTGAIAASFVVTLLVLIVVTIAVIEYNRWIKRRYGTSATQSSVVTMVTPSDNSTIRYENANGVAPYDQLHRDVEIENWENEVNSCNGDVYSQAFDVESVRPRLNSPQVGQRLTATRSTITRMCDSTLNSPDDSRARMESPKSERHCKGSSSRCDNSGSDSDEYDSKKRYPQRPSADRGREVCDKCGSRIDICDCAILMRPTNDPINYGYRNKYQTMKVSSNKKENLLLDQRGHTLPPCARAQDIYSGVASDYVDCKLVLAGKNSRGSASQYVDSLGLARKMSTLRRAVAAEMANGFEKDNDCDSETNTEEGCAEAQYFVLEDGHAP